MTSDIYTKLKNLIKAGTQASVIDIDLIEIVVLGKKQQARLIKPYGIEIDPPPDGLMYLLLSESGNEDSMLAIPVDIDGLIEPKIIFKDNEKIIFKVDDKEGGDFIARFNELKAGHDQLKSDLNSFITTYNLHTHIVTTPDTINGTAAPTISTGSPSTASIDNAKIENIEVPSL